MTKLDIFISNNMLKLIRLCTMNIKIKKKQQVYIKTKDSYTKKTN